MIGSGEHSGESKMKSSLCPLLMTLGTKGLNAPESHGLWKRSEGSSAQQLLLCGFSWATEPGHVPL